MSSFCILKLCSISPSYWMGTSNYWNIPVKQHFCYSPFVRFIHSSCSAMAHNCLRRPVFSFGCNLTFSDKATVAVQGCLLHHSILSMMLTITWCFRAYNPSMACTCLRRPVFSFGCNLTFSDMATVAVQGCLVHHSILSMMLTITGCFRAYNPFLLITFWAWSWSSSRSRVSFSMPDRILLAIHVYPFIIILNAKYIIL